MQALPRIFYRLPRGWIRERMHVETERDAAAKELQVRAEIPVHGLAGQSSSLGDQGDGGKRRTDGRVKLVCRLRDPAARLLDLVASLDHLVLAGHALQSIT